MFFVFEGTLQKSKGRRRTDVLLMAAHHSVLELCSSYTLILLNKHDPPKIQATNSSTRELAVRSCMTCKQEHMVNNNTDFLLKITPHLQSSPHQFHHSTSRSNKNKNDEADIGSRSKSKEP